MQAIGANLSRIATPVLGKQGLGEAQLLQQWPAIVARCAPPERFYGFIGVLFAQQGSWGLAQDPVPGISRIAKLGGMSDDQVQACLKDDALQNKVLAGRLAAEQQYQVESTPTFFINGKKVVGAKEEDIVAAIKSAAPKA